MFPPSHFASASEIYTRKTNCKTRTNKNIQSFLHFILSDFNALLNKLVDIPKSSMFTFDASETNIFVKTVKL